MPQSRTLPRSPHSIDVNIHWRIGFHAYQLTKLPQDAILVGIAQTFRSIIFDFPEVTYKTALENYDSKLPSDDPKAWLSVTPVENQDHVAFDRLALANLLLALQQIAVEYTVPSLSFDIYYDGAHTATGSLSSEPPAARKGSEEIDTLAHTARSPPSDPTSVIVEGHDRLEFHKFKDPSVPFALLVACVAKAYYSILLTLGPATGASGGDSIERWRHEHYGAFIDLERVVTLNLWEMTSFLEGVMTFTAQSDPIPSASVDFYFDWVIHDGRGSIGYTQPE